MTDPAPSPPAAGVAERVGRWAVPLLVAATTVWAFRAMFDQALMADDFGLILGNRDLGLDGFLRFLLFADYGDRQWAYWRPGWVLLFWLVHALFGADPLAFKCVALGLHVVCVLVLYRTARRATGSLVVAACASLLFALHAAHGEAVVWVAAALNVPPAAALLVAAASCLWCYARSGRVASLTAGFALAVASLLWKEAAYGFPLVMLAAWGIGRERGSWRRTDAVLALATAAFALVIASHYLLRNHVGGFAGSPADMLQVVAVSAAAFVRQLAAVPGSNVALAAGAAVAAVVLFLVLRGQARFWWVATVAGTLPYVFLSGGNRFAYFFHAPLCVALATALAGWLRTPAAPWRQLAVGGLLLLPLAFAPVQLHAEIDRFGAEAAKADRILSALVQEGHAASGQLFVDVVPECLMNGFEPALELRCNHPVQVQSLQAVPRPPFLIHILGDQLPARDRTILRFDAPAQRYVAMPFGDLLGGLEPVPLFALCHGFRVVADEAAARALLAAGSASPSAEPLLYEAPGAAIDAAGVGRITSVRTDSRDMGATVECTGTSLFVVAFPLPVDFRTPPGAIWIDGEPVPVLAANMLFHAVVVPKGTHDVRLLLAFR